MRGLQNLGFIGIIQVLKMQFLHEMFRFQEDLGILKNFILGDSDVRGLAPELEGM